jgi:hypothetical protein
MRFPRSLSSFGLLAIAASRHALAATGGSYCGTVRALLVRFKLGLNPVFSLAGLHIGND